VSRRIEQCLVEVNGYPNYRDELRWYVTSKGTCLAGPFVTKQEAIDACDAGERCQEIDDRMYRGAK
jgi:hypothetical protein